MKIGGKQIPSWALYGGIGVAVVGGVLWWRSRSSGSSTSSNATTAATDPNAIDPATGIPYSQEALGTYQGYTQGVSGYGYGTPTVSGTTTVGSAYTSNAQWAQAVEAGLTSLGYDPTAVGAAIGKYLLSMPLTADQVTIVQTAVAEFGAPPVGQFSITATGSSPGGSTPPPSGSGGGSSPPPTDGGGTPPPSGNGGGGTAGRLTAPTALHLTIDGRTGVRLQWNPVPGATGYICQCKKGGNNGPTVNGPFFTTAAVANFGGLTPGTAYTALIWPSDSAVPGGPGSNQPHTEFGFSTPK